MKKQPETFRLLLLLSTIKNRAGFCICLLSDMLRMFRTAVARIRFQRCRFICVAMFQVAC